MRVWSSMEAASTGKMRCRQAGRGRRAQVSCGQKKRRGGRGSPSRAPLPSSLPPRAGGLRPARERLRGARPHLVTEMAARGRERIAAPADDASAPGHGRPPVSGHEFAAGVPEIGGEGSGPRTSSPITAPPAIARGHAASRRHRPTMRRIVSRATVARSISATARSSSRSCTTSTNCCRRRRRGPNVRYRIPPSNPCTCH